MNAKKQRLFIIFFFVMRQSLFIFLAIALGLLFPPAHELTFLIRYTLMTMLFFVFLDMSLDRSVFQKWHLWVVVANLIIPLGLWYGLHYFDTDVSMAIFVVAIAPTAAAAPVIAHLLKAKAAYVTTSVLITTPVIAVVLPFILPLVVDVSQPVESMQLAIPILALVFVPLAISEVIKRWSSTLKKQLLHFKWVAFYLFLFNVGVASAKAGYFLRNSEPALLVKVIWIGVGVIGLCLFQFGLGYVLGRKKFAVEGSLGLGRKNTMFAIWIALEFIHPLAALGPMFYILMQNIFNSIQLAIIGKRKKNDI